MTWDIPIFLRLGSYKYPYYLSTLQILFKSFIRKHFLILDAGCGPNSEFLIRMPINIHGIGLDISRSNIENSIKVSRELGMINCHFIIGDLEKMPFREDIFDVIVCQDVLEHVKDKENAFNEYFFSLKRGGKILISTTNAFNPAMFIDNMLPKNVSEKLIRFLGDSHPQYERKGRLNPWNLKKKLIKHGLRMKKLLMIGLPPFGAPWQYNYLQTEPPKIFYLWIIFNKLTNIRFLKKFKEMVLVIAEK